jgi:hypothetical protein
MLARLRTFGLQGIDAFGVDVEVDATGGIPKTVLVGLPEQAVKESIHRIERAMANLGFNRPRGPWKIQLVLSWNLQNNGLIILGYRWAVSRISRRCTGERFVDAISNLTSHTSKLLIRIQEKCQRQVNLHPTTTP